jgi:hypothetical protein
MDIEAKHLLAIILLIGCGAAGLFATLFSHRMRDLALFAFIVGAVFVEKMSVTFLGVFWYRGTSRGIEITGLDLLPLCLLVATFAIPRYERGRFYWPASLGVLLLYLGYCTASVLHAQPQLFGLWELTKIVRGVMVFLAAALFVRTRREVGIVVLALCCTAWIESFNAFEQHYFKGTFRAPGTFDHENSLSTYLCMIAPVLVAAAMSNWSKWLRGLAAVSWALAAGGELLTLSRLGVPVFGFVSLGTALACTSFKLTKQKVAIAVVAVAAIGSFLVFSAEGLKARYQQGNIAAEFGGEHGFETRGMYWRLAMLMVQDHPYGVGLNNWAYYVSKAYGPELGYPYHDYDEIKWVPTKEDAAETLLAPAADTLPALTIGELGFVGLGVFLLIWLRWFQMGTVFLGQRLNNDPMHRLGIGALFGTAGIFLQNVTEWTYRQTAVMFSCHVILGMLASLYAARREVRREAKAAAELESEHPMDVEVIVAPAVRTAKYFPCTLRTCCVSTIRRNGAAPRR